MAYGSAPPKPPPTAGASGKRKPTPGANKLSSATLAKLQAHQKEGRSFSQSHAMAMKMVGK